VTRRMRPIPSSKTALERRSPASRNAARAGFRRVRVREGEHLADVLADVAACRVARRRRRSASATSSGPTWRTHSWPGGGTLLAPGRHAVRRLGEPSAAPTKPAAASCGHRRGGEELVHGAHDPAPSPTAEAARFSDPARTSPTANTPGMLVSYGSVGRSRAGPSAWSRSPPRESLTALPAADGLPVPTASAEGARPHRPYAVGQRRRLSCPTRRSSSATRRRSAVFSAWRRASVAAVSPARVRRQRAMRHRGEQTRPGRRPVTATPQTSLQTGCVRRTYGRHRTRWGGDRGRTRVRVPARSARRPRPRAGLVELRLGEGGERLPLGGLVAGDAEGVQRRVVTGRRFSRPPIVASVHSIFFMRS
jgi:hypothetical protein